MITILAKIIAEDNSDTISFDPGENPHYRHTPITFYALGDMGAAEEVVIQYPDGTDWRTITTLTATQRVKTLFGPLEFRVYKAATVAAVGCAVSHAVGGGMP